MTSLTTTSAPPAAIPSASDEIWYTRCPVPTAFEIAEAHGRFADALTADGYRWIPLAASDDPAVHASHFTHLKANSFRHGGNVPAIAARAAGADTRVIGASWLRTSYTVLALPGTGIRTPADLRGKRLLVPRRPHAAVDFWAASTLRVYEVAMASAGLTLDDVELVDTPADNHLFPQAGHADVASRLRWTLDNAYAIQRAILVPLLAGAVDAVTSQASYSYQLAALSGADVIFDQADAVDVAGRINNGAPDLVTVSGALLDAQPDVVDRVLGHILDGADWARDHHQEAFALISERVQIPEALLEATYGRGIGAELDVTLGPEVRDALASQVAFLHRQGFIAQPFDLDAWIDPAPLARVRVARGGDGDSRG